MLTVRFYNASNQPLGAPEGRPPSPARAGKPPRPGNLLQLADVPVPCGAAWDWASAADVYVEQPAVWYQTWFDDFEITLLGAPVATIVQESHNDPWGLELSGLNYQTGRKNQWQANGKTEREANFGINILETPFRGYDPALGRFHQPDAITDLLPGISSFSFAFNNPVYFNDPTGLAPSDTAAYSGQCPGEKEPNWAFNSSPGSFGGGGGGGSFVGGGGDGGGSQARPAGRAPGGGGVRPGAGRGGNNRREEFMRRQLEREQQQRLRELFGQGVKARTRRQYISEPGASGLPMEEMYDLNDFSIPIDNAERLKRLNEFLGRKAGKEDEGPLTTLYWIEVLNPGYYQCYSCEGYPGGSNDAEHTVTNSATKYPLIKLKAGDTWKFGITVESPLQVRYEKDPDPYVIEQIQRGNFVMRKITVGPRTLMRMKEKVLIAMYPHHKDNLERYKRTGVWLPRPPGNKQDN